MTFNEEIKLISKNLTKSLEDLRTTLRSSRFKLNQATISSTNDVWISDSSCSPTPTVSLDSFSVKSKSCSSLENNKSLSRTTLTNCSRHTELSYSHVRYLMLKYSWSKYYYVQLSYIGQDCNKIPAVLTTMYGSRVHCLDLSYNSITTLHGLDKFTNLEELIADNNCLSDSVVFPKLMNLHTLSVNKNNITNLELFIRKVGESFPNLKYLSMLGNRACPNQLSDLTKDEEDYRRYRYYVLYHMPRLQFLDSTQVTVTERNEAKRCGHLMKVAKPTLSMTREEVIGSSPVTKYTPLPSSRRGLTEHQGAYGKCKYRYSGKHSEGNRFIQNSDL